MEGTHTQPENNASRNWLLYNVYPTPIGALIVQR